MSTTGVTGANSAAFYPQEPAVKDAQTSEPTPHLNLSYDYADKGNARLALRHYALSFQETPCLGIPPIPSPELEVMIEAQFLEFAKPERIAEEAQAEMKATKELWLSDGRMHQEFFDYLRSVVSNETAKELHQDHCNEVSSIYNFAVALSHGEYKALLQDKKWQKLLPDLALLGVERGWLLPNQYATFMLSYEWAVKTPNIFANKFTVMSLFREDGSVNEEARKLIASTMRPIRRASKPFWTSGIMQYTGCLNQYGKHISDFLTHSQIDALFEKMKEAPKSERFIFVVDERDQTTREEHNEGQKSIVSFINFDVGFNVCAHAMEPSFEATTGDFVVASSSFYDAFIEVGYGDEAVHAELGIGTFTRKDIWEAQKRGYRKVGTSHPCCPLPTTADSRWVRRPTDFVAHDRAHCYFSSVIGKTRVAMYMDLAQHAQDNSPNNSPNEKFIERLFDNMVDLDLPIFRHQFQDELAYLSNKEHSIQNQLFWLGLADMAYYDHDVHLEVRKVLHRAVLFIIDEKKQWGELGITAESLKATAASLKAYQEKNPLAIPFKDRWIIKGHPLFTMEKALDPELARLQAEETEEWEEPVFI